MTCGFGVNEKHETILSSLLERGKHAAIVYPHEIEWLLATASVADRYRNKRRHIA